VVQPGAPKRLAQPVRQAFILTQHEAEHEPAPLPAQPGHQIVRNALAQAVAETADAAAATDDAPGARFQHDVNALASQPSSLVETARAWARRQLYRGAELEHGPDRRRLAGRQAEPDALLETRATEELDLSDRADRVGADARRPDHHDAYLRALADVRQEWAAIERGQPERAERETEEQEQRRARAETKARLPEKDDRGGQRKRHDRGNRRSDPLRVGQPQA
jgi:hypothetical protein